VSGGHVAPPSSAAVSTVRARLRVPAPHVVPHADQCDHSDVSQFTAHGAAAGHASVLCVDGQGSAPCWAATATSRVRARSPPPQTVEHRPHAPHDAMVHGMGHGCALHTCDFERAGGHATPAWACATSTVRVLCCCPPPHDSEQAPHSLQASSSQLTGQDTSWQAADCVSVPQGAPPSATATVTVRARDLDPSPHVFEQAPQEPHNDSMQSIGHACGLHARDCAAGHGTPLNSGITVISGTRPCVPLPQEREHCVQLPQPNSQAIGHSRSWHDWT
jgi:hypothetical protein